MPEHEEEDIQLPPHSLQAEQAVIGAALVANRSLLDTGKKLQPSDFYVKQHQLVWSAILDLWESLKPIDTLTVAEKLKELKKLKQAGDRPYLSELESSTVSIDNAGYYATQIKRDANRRKLIGITKHTNREAYENEDLQDLLSNLIRESTRIDDDSTRRGARSVSEIVVTAREKLDRIMMNGGAVTGIPSGIYDLDEKLFGFNGGELNIIAGRPGMGKTALMLNIALAQAKLYEQRILIVSLEMYEEDLTNRLLACISGLDATKFKSGKFNSWDLDDLNKASAILNQLPIHIVDQRAGITTGDDVVAVIEDMKIRGVMPNAVYVDHIGLLQGKGKVATRELEVSEISRTIKKAAAKYGIPVGVLCQLSRAVEARQDKHPQLSDIRESGSLEQDASIVLMMYRDEYYNPKESIYKGEAEIIIAKNRDGETGKIWTMFNATAQQFTSKGQGEQMKMLKSDAQEALPELLHRSTIEETLNRWEQQGGTNFVETQLQAVLDEHKGDSKSDQLHVRNWSALSDQWESMKATRALTQVDDLAAFYQD